MPRDEGMFPLKKVLAIATVIIVIVATVLTLTSAMVTVPAGYKGVLLNWGEVIGTLEPGFHWVSPIGQQVALVNVQVQKATADESAASSDLQEVTTSVTVNYQIDPAYAKEVYTSLREDYEARVIIPAMQDGLKATTAEYQASELITKREDTKNAFQTLLQQKLQQYHILVQSVSITNFKFSDQFQAAIDAKVTTEQNALAAYNQLQVVQYQAQQQVINATAFANATVIRANGTALAIQILSTQLTPEYIQYLYALGWDGHLPIYWVSGTNGTAPYLLITVPSTGNTSPSNATATATVNIQVSTVTLNSTQQNIGDVIAITATLNIPQSGIKVDFYNNEVQIGTALTNDQGQAVYYFTRTDAANYTFSAKVEK